MDLELGRMQCEPGPHVLLVCYSPGGPPAEGPNVAQLATAVAALLRVVREDPDYGVQDSIHSLNGNEIWKGGALIDGHLHVDDAIIGVGEEGVSATHPVSQDNAAKTGHEARQPVHRDVRMDIGQSDLQEGVCGGPAIDVTAGGGPPWDPPSQLCNGLLEDLISSKGHQEELLHLEHEDGCHSDGRELRVIDDEGGAVSTVVAGLDGRHIYQDRPYPGDMGGSRGRHRWRSGQPAAPPVAPIGSGISIGSWGSLLLIGSTSGCGRSNSGSCQVL